MNHGNIEGEGERERESKLDNKESGLDVHCSL